MSEQSPPERLMGEYIAEAVARFPDVKVTPQFAWRFLRDFDWRSDFAICVGDRTILVEVDGRRYHEGAEAFQRDRQKDRDAMWSGYRIFRYTAREVYSERDEIMADITDYVMALGIQQQLAARA